MIDPTEPSGWTVDTSKHPIDLPSVVVRALSVSDREPIRYIFGPRGARFHTAQSLRQAV